MANMAAAGKNKNSASSKSTPASRRVKRAVGGKIGGTASDSDVSEKCPRSMALPFR